MAQPTGIDLLLAESAIRRLAYTYARGGDRIDAELFTSTFWPEGIFDQQQHDRPVADISDELINHYMSDNFSSTHHLNGNILIDFIDEDHATAEMYFIALHLTEPHLGAEALEVMLGAARLAQESFGPGQSYEVVVGGRYLDVVERRDGIWKFLKRAIVFDYTTVRPSSGILPHEGLSAFSKAKMARDRSDPSYL